VDTGAGLERLAAVLQGKISNFDTDLFQPLIRKASELTGVHYGASEETDASLRIVADHFRAATFLIADGVVPSNEGRGYVLRKVIRRALQHRERLGATTFVGKHMASEVCRQMEAAYPELREAQLRAIKTLDNEETKFTNTVSLGLAMLIKDIDGLRTRQNIEHIVEMDEADRTTRFPGEKAFRLYDTYGLPLDFIEDVLRDRKILFDRDGFDRAMEEQRTRAKASWKGAHKEAAKPAYAKLAGTFTTEPDFYHGTTARDCRIEAIITKDGAVNELPAGAEGEIVLDRTSIYAESGGQQADTGTLRDPGMAQELAAVSGAYYPVSRLIAHRVTAKEALRVGDRVATMADPERRVRDMRNHTATHLMNAALRNILGTHVKQAGSLVAPDHLRFDFSHFAAVEEGELRDIEDQVNEEILRNLEMRTDVMAIDEALASGALAFFGDKYPEANVRVVSVLDPGTTRGSYSKELCGGTHVVRTGEIGLFKITGEQSVAAGVRRIVAITGDATLARLRRAAEIARGMAERLGASEEEAQEKLAALIERAEKLEKERDALKQKAALSGADELLAGVRRVKDVPVIASQVAGMDRETMRQLVDMLRQRLGSGVVTLISTDDGKVSLITGVTKDLIPRVHAGKIVQALAKHVGGSGGGRPDLAEAGGKDAAGVQNAIAALFPLLDGML